MAALGFCRPLLYMHAFSSFFFNKAVIYCNTSLIWGYMVQISINSFLILCVFLMFIISVVVFECFPWDQRPLSFLGWKKDISSNTVFYDFVLIQNIRVQLPQLLLCECLSLCSWWTWRLCSVSWCGPLSPLLGLLQELSFEALAFV